MKTLHFHVAEVYYAITFTDDEAPYKELLPTSAPFYEPSYNGEVIFYMTVGDGLVSTEAAGEEVGDFECAGIGHKIYRTAEGYYKIIISNSTSGLSCAFCASPDFSECKATLFGSLPNQTFGMSNANMIAFAFAGAKHRILLMHSSVPMLNGYGYLFQGKSGTGKSTHSSLWLRHIEGTELLNDDNPAVRMLDDGNVYVYGTPWSGKTPCYRNLRARVGAFLRLHQDPENRILKFTPLQAFGSILSSSSAMIWDKDSYKNICDTISAIVAHVPAYELYCRPDKEAALLSYSTIAHK